MNHERDVELLLDLKPFSPDYLWANLLTNYILFLKPSRSHDLCTHTFMYSKGEKHMFGKKKSSRTDEC